VSEIERLREKLRTLQEIYERGSRAQMGILLDLTLEVKRLKIAGRELATAVANSLPEDQEIREALIHWWEIAEGEPDGDADARLAVDAEAGDPVVVASDP
jgi:hypothetical protein